MSTSPKPRGGGNSELTRFKLLWRDSLAEPAREYWRSRFVSAATQADLRRELLAKLKINFTRDNQLTLFRQWLEVQDAREAEAAQAEQDRKELETLGLRGEALRAELIDRMKSRALLEGDWALGASAVKLDLKAEQVAVDQRKLALLERKAAAFDAAQKVSADTALSPEEKEAEYRRIFGMS